MPWIFLIWLIGQGIGGQIDALLVFALLFILIPGAMVLNLLTVVGFQGRAAIKMIRNVQKGQNEPKQIESANYADLPWWNPKRWMR
jgi:hypothetical protein